MQPAASEDPLVGLLHAFPCGVFLLRDSLAASGHFLLPWLTSAALGQGHKVGKKPAASPVARLRSTVHSLLRSNASCARSRCSLALLRGHHRPSSSSYYEFKP
jgi:hypothetical protein